MKSKKSRLLVLLVLGLALPVASQAKNPDQNSSAEQSAAKSSAPAADMEVVNDADRPFPPSYITTSFGKEKLSELDFEDPSVCASCHPAQFEGWKGSMHANSLVDPVFQKVWDMAEKANNEELMNHCGACHTPVGVMTGNVVHDRKEGKFTAGPVAEQGVFCDVCHTITKTNFLQTAMLEHGNASYKIEPTGPGGAKRGPFKDAVSPYHTTEYSDLHTRAEFCGNCHQIFNPLSGFPVERTYDEWKYSPYARAGIVCQDCHMNPVDVAVRVAQEMKPPQELNNSKLGGVAGTGAKSTRTVVHSHNFVGGNTLVTSLLHGKDSVNYKEATKRLQSAAELDVNLKKRPDGLYDLRATVHNVASGHYLPTSLTDIREVWIEVVVRDSQDKVIFSSGVPDAHGDLDYDNVTMFHSIALDANGKETHLPWEVFSFESNTAIPPKGSATGTYVFDASKAHGELKVDVKLNYRSYSQHLADAILGKNAVEVPIVVMQRKSFVEKI